MVAGAFSVFILISFDKFLHHYDAYVNDYYIIAPCIGIFLLTDTKKFRPMQLIRKGWLLVIRSIPALLHLSSRPGAFSTEYIYIEE